MCWIEEKRGFVSGFEFLSLSQPYRTRLPFTALTAAREHPALLPAAPGSGCRSRPTPLPPAVSPHPRSAALPALRSQGSRETKESAHEGQSGLEKRGRYLADESGTLNFGVLSASSFPGRQSTPASRLENLLNEFGGEFL